MTLPTRPAQVAALAFGGGLILLLESSTASSPGSFAELIQKATPSVVTVLVERKPEDAAQRAVERAAAARDTLLYSSAKIIPPDDRGIGLGSGFIISADGLIVTNRHVIADGGQLRVRLASGRECSAQIVGSDTRTDIALLKVDAHHLPLLRLGSSTAVAVGDPVVAIGNPFGVGESATAGIISARGRAIPGDPYIDFLQTDAAINRGNSGGPLLSANGEVIGVTSTILSPTGGSIGLGFAIPAETVAAVVRDLRTHGRVDRGYLGISAQPLTPELARALGLTSARGALVTAVEPDGPATRTLFIGDLLERIGSAPVASPDLGRLTARLRPGTMVEVAIVRDGEPRTVFLNVGRLPDPPADSPTVQGDTWVPTLGLGVATVSDEIRRAIHADDESGGLIVTQLRPAGAGALAGLQIGDLITHLRTKQLYDATQLADAGRPSTRLPLLLRVVRDGIPQFISITGAPAR
jgi:serine protease Do